MKKYITVTEQYTNNAPDVRFCVTESEDERSVVSNTVLICDARTDDFVRKVRWMICTKYGLTDDEYERAYCGDSEEEYYDGAAENFILETTERYMFEVEE